MSHDVVNKIIEQSLFEHYCQPIFDLNKEQQAGGELLLRTQFGTPDVIFQQAKKQGKLFELDIISIIKAMNTAPVFKDQFLFLNIFPSTIKNPLFFPFIEEIILNKQINCSKVVFELNESEKVQNIGLLSDRINKLRDMGFLFACDDVGKGTMYLTYMMELNVNFVKLDRDFSNDLANSIKIQDMVSAIKYFCQLNNIMVILEGIEDEETLMMAKKLGVDMGQGYYLGMPEKIISDTDLIKK